MVARRVQKRAEGRPQPTFDRYQDAFAKALADKQNDALRLYASMYERAADSLAPKWAEAADLLSEAVARGVTGDALSGYIWSEQRLAYITNEAYNVYQGLAREIGDDLTTKQRTVQQLADDSAQHAIGQALNAAGGTSGTSFPIADFFQYPEAEVGMIGSRVYTGPLSDTIVSRFAQQHVELVRSALIEGVANGESPNLVARRIANATGQGFGRTNLMVRSQMLGTYRDRTSQVYQQNKRIVKNWLWWSARQDRTCALCWAMHGTLHELDERMETHLLCRCMMKPVVRPWAEINPRLAGVSELPLPPTGSELFKALPAGRQRKILGPTMFNAYKAKNLSLSELPERTFSPIWGGGRRQRTLSEILGPGKARKYRRP